MRSRGFGYSEVPVGDVQREAATSPYGLLPRSRAAQDGYGLTVQRLKTPPADPNAQRLSALSERERGVWEAALKGAENGPRQVIELPEGPSLSIPTGSCASVARQKVYGTSWERNHFTLQNLSNSIVEDTLDHPLVKAAERKWVVCMRHEGFPYQDREDPLRAMRRHLDSGKSDAAGLRATGEEELRIARRDAACQAEADLAEQVARAQKLVESALSPARTSVLKDFRAARQAALTGAGVPLAR
ncbi:hypothetical protein ADL12_14940 [Streptomyces regalis]|uniref:Uncharacterized protein n=2 Tax=Streptomyces regalis TaxID=68262 RepID=A0A0X3V4M7_9ACTN|nr:hypothetical protein ADL12_14940 [Streptomyces regalis]